MSFDTSMFPIKDTMTVEEKTKLLQEAAQNGGWRQLKQNIIKFNEMREQVVNDMENQSDPLFRRYLKMYKTKLGAAEFLKNRLQIYAICNQRAMQERVSVDKMVRFTSYDPETDAAHVSDNNRRQQGSD